MTSQVCSGIERRLSRSAEPSPFASRPFKVFSSVSLVDPDYGSSSDDDDQPPPPVLRVGSSSLPRMPTPSSSSSAETLAESQGCTDKLAVLADMASMERAPIPPWYSREATPPLSTSANYDGPRVDFSETSASSTPSVPFAPFPARINWSPETISRDEEQDESEEEHTEMEVDDDDESQYLNFASGDANEPLPGPPYSGAHTPGNFPLQPVSHSTDTYALSSTTRPMKDLAVHPGTMLPYPTYPALRAAPPLVAAQPLPSYIPAYVRANPYGPQETQFQIQSAPTLVWHPHTAVHYRGQPFYPVYSAPRPAPPPVVAQASPSYSRAHTHPNPHAVQGSQLQTRSVSNTLQPHPTGPPFRPGVWIRYYGDREQTYTIDTSPNTDQRVSRQAVRRFVAARLTESDNPSPLRGALPPSTWHLEDPDLGLTSRENSPVSVGQELPPAPEASSGPRESPAARMPQLKTVKRPYPKQYMCHWRTGHVGPICGATIHLNLPANHTTFLKAFRQHMLSAHGQNLNPSYRGNIRCAWDGCKARQSIDGVYKVYKGSHNYMRHLLRTDMPDHWHRYECEKCGEEFLDKEAGKRHTRKMQC